jgi:hypothetical protein
MGIEDYDLIMLYLDIIEAELDRIAKATGHITLKEFNELHRFN